MIESGGHCWIVWVNSFEKARLYQFPSYYRLIPMKGKDRCYKTFQWAMKALKKYEEV